MALVHTKHHRPGPDSLRQEYFKKVLPIVVYVKRSRSIKGYHFFQTSLDSYPQSCIPSPRSIGPLAPDKTSMGFTIIVPSLSCNPDAAKNKKKKKKKISFPLPIEASCEIWLWLAQWLLSRRRVFRIWVSEKESDPWDGAIFLRQGNKLSNFGRGQQAKATYKMSKAWGPYWFRQEDF